MNFLFWAEHCSEINVHTVCLIDRTKLGRIYSQSILVRNARMLLSAQLSFDGYCLFGQLSEPNISTSKVFITCPIALLQSKFTEFKHRSKQEVTIIPCALNVLRFTIFERQPLQHLLEQQSPYAVDKRFTSMFLCMQWTVYFSCEQALWLG